MHLSFADLLSVKEENGENLKFDDPKDFKQTLRQLDDYLDSKENESVADQYYKALLKHEIDNFYSREL